MTKEEKTPIMKQIHDKIAEFEEILKQLPEYRQEDGVLLFIMPTYFTIFQERTVNSPKLDIHYSREDGWFSDHSGM